MDELFDFDADAVARSDQAEAEAEDWARRLVRVRSALREGGFSAREAYRLSRLILAEQWYRQHADSMFADY